MDRYGFGCPKCGKKFVVKRPEYRGRQMRCIRCSHAFPIPAEEREEPRGDKPVDEKSTTLIPESVGLVAEAGKPEAAPEPAVSQPAGESASPGPRRALEEPAV